MKSKKIQWVFLVTAVGICIAAPFVLFELVKIISLGWQDYLNLQEQTLQLYKKNALAGEVQNRKIVMLNEIKKFVIILIRMFNVESFVLIPVTLYLVYDSLKRKTKETSSAILAGVTLILCFFIYLYWWLHFSASSSDRHIVIAIICYVVGVMLLIASLDYKAQMRFQTASITLFVLLFFVSRDCEIKFLASEIMHKNDQKLQEQLAIVESLKKLERQGVEMVSCGNNFELEYLLSHSRNFKKCEEILDSIAHQPRMLVTYFVDPISKHFVSINHDQYQGSLMQIPEAVVSKCSREYLRTENYSLNWCSSD